MRKYESDIDYCPHCGGEPELKFSDQYYWIECKECHAKSNEENVETFDRGHAETIKIVVSNWNRRINPMLDCCCFGGNGNG